MNLRYINFSFTSPQSNWERSSFFQAWWRLAAVDWRWTPPYYPDARQALEPLPRPGPLRDHLARLERLPLLLEALQRRPNANPRPYRREQIEVVEGGLFEQPVAAQVNILDPRRKDGAALLAWLHADNYLESLARLLDQSAGEALEAGATRQFGPMELSSYLGWGVLINAWDQSPPLHTPYHPPYLAELFDKILQPAGEGRLYWLETPRQLAYPSGPALISPGDPQELGASLLPLMEAACRATLPASLADGAPPLDPPEVAFLLHWLSLGPLHTRLAIVEGTPAGFILLQGDTAPVLRQANGGRNRLWRAWLQRALRRPTYLGRLVWGAVLPAYRRRGLGRQLLQAALEIAARQGWERLAVGPLPMDNLPALALLDQAGARPLQSYRLYQREL